MLQISPSPELQAWATGFPLTLSHALVTILILVAGAALYTLITPHREIALIRRGNNAAALSFGGVLVGLAIPLAACLAASTSLLDIALWAASTVFVQLAVFRLIDLILHVLQRRIALGETAAAVVLVAVKLATSVVLAAAVAA